MGNANAMINYNSNIAVVIKAKLAQIQALKDNPDPILRTVALAVLPELRQRVHVEGKDSSGGQIGTYSPGYMKIRTGDFQNAGKNDSGFNTKGKNSIFSTKTQQPIKVKPGKQTAGSLRPRYNRTSDTKVILSLTRQMENDMSVVATGKGYGIGYNNPDNLKKARWNEATYKKKILTKLTKEEIALAKKTAIEFTLEYLKTL